MRRVTYKAKSLDTKELFHPCFISFDNNGKMTELSLYKADGNSESVDPTRYEIIYAFEDFTDEEIDKIVKENRKNKEKFRIGT